MAWLSKSYLPQLDLATAFCLRKSRQEKRTTLSNVEEVKISVNVSASLGN